MNVTYVDNRLAQRDWKKAIVPPIQIFKTIKDYLDSTMGDVLIIHGGQPEATVRLNGRQELLVEALLRVCAGGGRAIIFSGGYSMIGSRLLRDALESASFREEIHYLFLPTTQRLDLEIDLERLLEIKLAPDWPIKAARLRRAAPTLMSLALLCQSALLAFDPRLIEDDAVSLLGGRDTMSAIRSRHVFSGEHLLSPLSWHGALGITSSSAVQEAIEQEWPEGSPRWDALRDLVDTVYERQRALDPRTVAGAFVELHHALERNQELHH